MTHSKWIQQGKCIAVSAVFLLLGTGRLEAEENELSLQEVLVVSQKAEVYSEAYRQIRQLTHEEISSLPIRTIADILQYIPGVDVRSRGTSGAQADLSMRGGTFDQVLVLLNGVPLNDAQTGHYSLHIPVSAELIERVEVLQGTSASLIGAFSGAINIITRHADLFAEQDKHKKPIAKDVALKMTAGMNGLVTPEVAATIRSGETQINLSGEYSRAEGYYAPTPSEKEAIACRNSDMQSVNLYTQVRWRGLDVQSGAQWKDAGLGMGYGFGSQDQWDATRTAFGAVRYVHHWGAWRLDAQAAYRVNHDRYEWHRGQGQYSNRHLLQTATTALSAHYASRIGTTSFGIGIRNDNIRSTNLRDTNRLQLHYFAEQTFHYAGLSASLGVNGTYNTQFGYHMGGGATIGYAFAHSHHVYANAHRSLRMPTFTDLYYDAGNQLGNPHLRPEEAWLLDVGCKGEWRIRNGERGRLTYSADAFYRWGRNIIDWMYVEEDTRRPYHAENQQRVNATGVEVSVAYRLNEWLRCVSVDYGYTYLDLNLKESGSRYLDYLSHKLTIHLEHGIYKGFGAAWTVRFQKREGQYNNADGKVQDYAPIWLLDGSIFWQNSHLRVSADCTNMTNRHYYDYGGILQPGAWAKMTITAHI